MTPLTRPLDRARSSGFPMTPLVRERLRDESPLDRARSSGFTLVEMLVVVALLFGLSAASAFGIAGTTRSQEAAALARSIQFALLQARGEAIADGTQRRLSCTATGCNVQLASAPGMAPPSAWSDGGTVVAAGRASQVWAVDAQTDLAPAQPAGPLTGTKTVTLFPDGSASAATVFVCDASCDKRYKVFLFSATGMPRLSDQW
jgi:prepilin-type N-terminal cleavage/methylation domain-containing protein